MPLERSPFFVRIRPVLDLDFLASTPLPLAVDSETSGVRWWRDKVGVVSFAWGADESGATRDVASAIQAVSLRLSRGLPTIFHNSPFDLHMMFPGEAVNWSGIEDTLIMARLHNNLGRNKLKELGQDLLGIAPAQQDELKKYLKSVGSNNFLDAPDEILLPYAEQDTRLTWMLWHELKDKVSSLYPREMRIRKLMYDAETAGVQLDQELCQERLEWALKEQAALYQKLQQVRGKPFNPDSNPDLIEWLYDDLGLTPVSFTPGGQRQVNEYSLAYNPHPATKLLMAYNKRSSAVKYFSQYLEYVDDTGFLHPSINTMQARTHRFSVTDPSLQQIPVRKDRFHTRDVFISGSGYFIGADFAKQELFIAACEGNETQLMQDLAADREVYREIASGFLDKSESSITPDEREAGKVGILAKLYGAGAPKLAEIFTIKTGKPYSKDRAKQMGTNINRKYPGLYQLMQDKQREAKSYGKVTNRWGRDLYVEQERAYVATDYLVQSSGRDVLADGLENVAGILPHYGGHLLWPIHDEALIWVPEEPGPALMGRIAAAMKCEKFTLPLTAKPKSGKRLSDLK